MISLESFGCDSGGAVRCVYDGGTRDWLVHPFRNDECKAVQVISNDRFVVLGNRHLALFDAEQQVCFGQLELSDTMRFAVASAAQKIVLFESNKRKLSIYSGRDLSLTFRTSDLELTGSSALFERYDGAMILSGTSRKSKNLSYVIKCSEELADITKFVTKQILYYPHQSSWLSPDRRTLLTWDLEPPLGDNEKTVAVTLLAWDLERIAIDRRIVVDRLPVEFHPVYWGQDRTPQNDANYVEWQETVAKLDLDDTDRSSHRTHPTGTEDCQEKFKERKLARLQFSHDTIRDVAWEADSRAFWVLQYTGILRRLDLNGSQSPRYVIEQFATPPALAKKTWGTFPPWAREHAQQIDCLSDGQIRVVGGKPGQAKACFHYDPVSVKSRKRRIERFLPDSLIRNQDMVVLRKADEVPISNAKIVPRNQALSTTPTSCSELPPAELGNAALKARCQEFEQNAIAARVPLESLSAKDCIAAIDWLTAAIRTRFPNLRCNYWFRPVFTPQKPFDGAVTSLSEEQFFEHIVFEGIDAVTAIERMVTAYLDEAPRHRMAYVDQLYGPDEETPALAHAVKALILLDPTRYGVLERYIRSIDVEHDGYVKDSLAPLFGEANGWRDVEAIRLGVVWMIAQWCGGYGGYGFIWTEHGMSTEVQVRMAPEHFGQMFRREAVNYLSRSEAEQRPNSAAWNKNAISDFLDECRKDLFASPTPFHQKIVMQLNASLQNER